MAIKFYLIFGHTLFLGAFAKLREGLLASSCLSACLPACLSVCVRPSVRMEQLDSHWTDFHEIWYLNIFRKSVDKIQI
jgi:hypothetical protein